MPNFNFGMGLQSNPVDAYQEMAGIKRDHALKRLLGDYYSTGNVDLGAVARINPEQAQGIQAEQERRGIAKLLGEAYSAPEDQRKGLLAQIMARDPTMGMNAAKMFDPRFAAASGMFAQKVGEDGFIYNAMRDGRMVNTGIKADRQMWFRDNPGMAPELVGKDGNVRPVGYGASPQAKTPAPQFVRDVPEGSAEGDAFAARAAELGNMLTAANVPPDQIDAIIQKMMGGDEPLQEAPGFVPAQAKPAMTAAQMLAAQQAQQASQRADRADSRAERADARAQAEFERKSSQPLNAQAQKEQAAIRAKVPQLQNAIRGMGRIESAINKLDGKFVNTGPMDALVQKYTPEGQELEAAVGAIQNSVLALTRVPGIGSQSDLEARIAALQYPSLDKPPEVNRRTLDNLKLFMRDLAEAYKLAVQPGQAKPAEPSASGGFRILPD